MTMILLFFYTMHSTCEAYEWKFGEHLAIGMFWAIELGMLFFSDNGFFKGNDRPHYPHYLNTGVFGVHPQGPCDGGFAAP